MSNEYGPDAEIFIHRNADNTYTVCIDTKAKTSPYRWPMGDYADKQEAIDKLKDMAFTHNLRINTKIRTGLD